MKKIVAVLLAALMLLGTLGALAEEAELTQAGVDRSKYPWGEYLTETDVVSEAQGKDVYIQYTELFDEYVYENPDETIGDLTYYFYDPIAHGADPEGTYPLVMWLHGGGNATQGRTAIMLCGAAAYASEEFQEELGGMYILFPMANPDLGWTEDCTATLKGIVDEVTETHDIQGEFIVAGQSMGGFMTNYWLEDYAEDTDIVMWINTRVPDVETVRKYSDMGIIMWAENGIHDETIAFTDVYPDGPEAYDGIENFQYTVLEWIRNGDKSIVSINYSDDPSGEMGQHCSCLQYNRNLIFDDGTPDDPNLPEGVTGWIRDALTRARA